MRRKPSPHEEPILTSELLLRMEAMAREGDVQLGKLLEAAGSRAHAMALVVLVLPEALPLPVVGLSTIFGIPLMILSGHLVVFGSGRGIPRRLAQRSLPSGLVLLVAGKAAPVLRWVERLSRPRWQHFARRERLLALACLVLALVITLPIPFGNLPPAVCLLAIAAGMVQRDGMLAAAGLAGAVAVSGIAVIAADFLARWVGGFFAAG